MARFCSRCNGLCTLLCERHFRSDPKTYLDASKTTEKRDARRSGFLGFGVVYESNCGQRVFRMAYLDSFDSCASLSNEEDSLQTLVKIHSVFAWVFIFLSLHSLRLMKVSDFYMPFGLSIVAITVVGLWASINLLRKGPGWQKKMKAHVTSISEVGSDCIRLEMKTPLGKEVLPGQFLFVHLPGDEGHPFSIAEFSDDEVILWIKKSGDFTNFLLERLHTGDIVEVEGPWGEFITIFSKKPQSWCAAGIGIAPFNAWLKAAAKNKHGSITLFWTVKDQRTAPFVEAVRKEAEEADVHLMLIDKSQARLTVKQIMQDKPEFVAFCGLALLQKQLRNENYSKNLIIKHEVFNWRDI